MEADYMIMEGLAFGMPPGSGKALSEHLLHQLQVWLLIKSGVEAQDGSGPLQVVAAELQLCHCVDCITERAEGALQSALRGEHAGMNTGSRAQVLARGH